MNQSQFGFLAKMLYLCTTKEEATQFPPFFGSKMAIITSKEGKISSNIGETTSKIVFPISKVANFALNFALETSLFGAKTFFFKKIAFVKQSKKRCVFRIQKIG